MNNENLVLIIENNVVSHNIVTVLKQAGYTVGAVGDSESAIEFIRQRTPVLLICNGVSDKSLTTEICHKIRSSHNLNLPLCLVGDERSQPNQTHLRLETGADEYIETPIDPLRFIKTVTSLIEQQRTKDSLEQKDVIFRSLIESITDIITVISPEGFVLYESPSVKHILGRKPVDSLGVNAFNFIHPDDRQRVVNYISNANREEAEKGIEYRIQHNDGSWRVFHSVGRYNKSIFKKWTILITSRDVTARNLLAERHQLALEKARMVWWEWNPAKDEVVVSDNFSEIYGLSNAKKAEEVFALIHPEDEKKQRKLVKGIAKSGGSYHSEFRIIRPNDGKKIWLEETATAVLDVENKVERLVGIAVDVSERKKTEKDLRESEEKFKALFKGIPIPVYIWEKVNNESDFVLINSNDAGDRQTTSFSSRYFGMRASELLDDEPDMFKGLVRCSQERQIVHIETEYHHQETGVLKMLDLYFVCISPSLVMAVSRDITQEKFAEDERAKLLAQIEFQNRRLSDIIASIPGAVWESRVEGDVHNQQNNFVSDYIEKITGYAPKEWLSEANYWLKIIHPDDKEEIIKKTEDFIQNRGEGFLEYRFIKKSGEIVWTETQMKAVRNEDGNVINLTGITIDVTERKRAEEALIRSEEQLRQSQRLESVGRLAGGIAHDFNNMLTAINGYSELLLRDLKEDTSIRQKVLEIKKAGERSASLTQQLLAFSRRQVLKPQMLDVNNVITDMESLLRRLIGEHIYLNIKLSEDECRVEADPGQLSQVIMNLAVNARDAMSKGGDLTIKTENMYLDEEYAAAHVPTIPGDYVLLSVSDTGVGVGEEAKKHIFEPFFTTKEKGAGTGLGLATVYGIVKQSGGYIWVDSEPEKGASFMVFLPQVQKVVTISKEKIRYEAEMPGSETILLVEDEESVRELTVKILEMNGYSVIEAEDGVEAFEIYKSGLYKIDLLITDVVMPRMSGRELTEKIKQLDPDIRVLFSSGYSDDRDMMRDADSKTIDFINKPFTSDELSRKIRYLLDKPIENNKTEDVENLLEK